MKRSEFIAVITASTLLGALAARAGSAADAPWPERFALTLEDGWRAEAFGPFFYSEAKGENLSETTWAVIPFYSDYHNPAVEARERNILYPLYSDLQYGQERRWQLGQLISSAGGAEPDGTNATRRFTVYPFYFQQRSTDTNLNYTALAPFYGHVKHRLMHDEVFFVMFPFYAETRKGSVVTENYLWPFVTESEGPHLYGWQVWPFVGTEHKDAVLVTNGFGDVSVDGGHDRSFLLWPFCLRQDNDTGTENPVKFRASIPFFASSRSPQRDSTSYLWPFFTWVNDRDRKYHEWEGPWPFVIFTRGEGKTTDRVFPLFSRSHNATQESDSYAWPAYTYRRTHSGALDFRRTRVGFYLYEDIDERNLETGKNRRRIDMWPFFTWHKDFNGNERLRVFSPVEPALPDQRGIERNWAPFWSVWRAEHNPHTGVATQSLLWNLYRSETRNGQTKVSWLFGLFHHVKPAPVNPADAPNP